MQNLNLEAEVYKREHDGIPTHCVEQWCKLANMLRGRTGPEIDQLLDSIHGGLSSPSKMPCKSTSLPAQACKVGSKLRSFKGGNTVCSGCYAMKGFYRMPNVARALENRLRLVREENPLWGAALAVSIARTGNGYFRFHDSGDIQSHYHLHRIFDVCSMLPRVKFWLPTRERRILEDVSATRATPENLTVRLSAAMVDAKPPSSGVGWRTSTVHDTGDPIGFECRAPYQRGFCADCRACWDPDITNVSYKKH